MVLCNSSYLNVVALLLFGLFCFVDSTEHLNSRNGILSHAYGNPMNFGSTLSKRAPPDPENATNLQCYENCTNYLSGRHTVKIGCYINKLAALDVDESHVRLDAYIWIRWRRCSIDQFGELLRPDLSISIENAIQKVDLTFQPLFVVPECNAFPGFVYQLWRIEGQFSQKLRFQKYPLDDHSLALVIEDNLYSRDYIVYEKDDLQDEYPASGYSENAYLTGWILREFVEKETNSMYKTNWGAIQKFYAASSYSNYRFSVKISRGVVVFVLRLLPPLLITLLISGLVFLMDVEALEVRIATAVTGILTIVFLQLQYSDKLPPSLDHMTLMDWIFNMGYCMNLCVVIECIVIRKIYYRLLLLSQGIKDEIQMLALFSGKYQSAAENIANSSNVINSSNGTNDPNDQDVSPEEDTVKEKMTDYKRRKDKIKRRIRRIEKIFFVIYGVGGMFTLIVITLAVKLAPDD